MDLRMAGKSAANLHSPREFSSVIAPVIAEIRPITGKDHWNPRSSDRRAAQQLQRRSAFLRAQSRHTRPAGPSPPERRSFIDPSRRAQNARPFVF